jgi:hypothetical protein
MSIEAMTWALTGPVGGNAKVVLLGLANHAHPDGTEAYPAYDTLAVYGCCDRSTAKRNAHRLEAAGWIARDGVGPRGEVKWRLAMGDPFGEAERTGGQNAPGGENGENGGAPAPPEPSKETSKGNAGRAPEDEFPEDLPAELHPAAIAAGKILKRTAQERRQRRPVTRAAVGHAVLTYADRDHVRVAREVEGWVLHGKGARKPCSDIVARFRNFLANADPAPGPPLPPGAARSSGGGVSISDMRDEAARLREQGL